MDGLTDERVDCRMSWLLDEWTADWTADELTDG